MVIQNKTFMNFLGGEVSPSAYKRLDMAGNAKWFETAKNIWFGTTGDFHNRRGFQYIAKTALGISGEKIKLIPFYFNREQSFCIEFNSNTFRILRNGVLLRDGNDNIINIRHDGLSVEYIDDISYCQVADILYICTGDKNKIFTISRYSDTDWRWEEFKYEIPPMRPVNEDRNKTLLFSKNNSYNNYGFFVFPESKNIKDPIKNCYVKIFINNVETTIYSSSDVFPTIESFVSNFNSEQTGSTYIDRAQITNDGLCFVLTQDGYDDVSSIKFGFDYNEYGETVYTYPIGNTYNGLWQEYDHNYNGSERYMRRYIPFPSNLKIRKIELKYFDDSYDFEGTPASFEYSLPYSAPADVANSIPNTDKASISYSGDNFILTGTAYREAYGGYFFRREITKIIGEVKGSQEIVYQSSEKKVEEFDTNYYNIEASFDFFENKKVGDVFSVDSIFSPNTDGKAGENKSFYSNNISTGETTTDVFWSNGNWRIVTSGLFSGTIELQYSYDNVSWFTHRTFSSSIRTENQVSYGTNYNEYGSLDVDDNVLLRLHFNITAQTNLAVVLDTESFKNRSYYRILTKDEQYSNTKATVECIKYSIGTPGIKKHSSGEQFIVDRIYEWAEAAWSDAYGYPKIAFLYQDRLAFANTLKDSSVIWFSKTKNYKDFSTKIEYTDDDPISINVLTSTGIGEITNVASVKKLFVFTSENENGIQDEGALTQANKQLLNFTFYGSEPIQTRNISNKIIFVERGGTAARALTYDYSQENYEALDLTIPYKHLLTNEKIIATEYIPGNYKTYLMLTSSGRIICFKYLPEQRIEACSRFEHTSGRITNICVVPYNNEYHLYAAVDDGSNKQLEVMRIAAYSSNIFLDSFKQYSFETETDRIVDEDYFIPGQEYTVIINDLKYKIVANEIKALFLPVKTTNCVVGLSYVSEATLLPPNLLFQNGTTNYNRKNVFKAHFSYLDSALFKVGIKGRDGSFKKVYAIEEPSLNGAERVESGDRHFPIQSSYFDQNMLSFVQEDPAPMNITNAEMEIDYGGK